MVDDGTPIPGVKGTRTEAFAWALYDWANSAYSTLSITIFFGYLTAVVFAPDDDWGPTIWAWGISLSMLVAAVLSPIVGAMADANASKRRWLAATALPGAGAAVLLALVPPSWTWVVVALFVVMSLLFELSLGFYNGFLPELVDEHGMNRLSAWGYALGYIGGALALVLALAVKIAGPSIGLPDLSSQLRAGVLVMGLWWGLFSLPTLCILRDRGRRPERPLPTRQAAARAVGEVAHTLRNIRRYAMLSLFLLGFLFYNDGVQTVISQASTFATKTPELSFSNDELILLILMVQVLAFPGAMLVGYLADRLGQKPTLIGCLAIWVGLLVAAYFVANKPQFWVLGVVLAMVLGGTQSVSRAVMGMMTPPNHTAEFFGFFNLSGKATSFLGTFLFGLVFKLTGDPRLSVTSLLVFFLLGWALVTWVDIDKGRRQAMEA